MDAFFVYICFLLFFHASEFALAATFVREDLALLLSQPYCFALALGMLEFWLERPLKLQIGQMWVASIRVLGLLMMISGELLRKTAMITAGASFTHRIKTTKRESHVLKTRGVYSVCRHPGYAGWFLWSVGSQVFLCNPICTAGFAVVVSRFFRERVPYEECHLERLFGEEYVRYARRTPIWLPGVRGAIEYRGRDADIPAFAGRCQ